MPNCCCCCSAVSGGPPEHPCSLVGGNCSCCWLLNGMLFAAGRCANRSPTQQATAPHGPTQPPPPPTHRHTHTHTWHTGDTGHCAPGTPRLCCCLVAGLHADCIGLAVVLVHVGVNCAHNVGADGSAAKGRTGSSGEKEGGWWVHMCGCCAAAPGGQRQADLVDVCPRGQEKSQGSAGVACFTTAAQQQPSPNSHCFDLHP